MTLSEAIRLEILKSQQDGTREGRNGRLSTRVVTTWMLLADGVLVGEFDTRHEAVARRDAIRRTGLAEPEAR